METASVVVMEKPEKSISMNYLKEFSPRLYQESIFSTCTQNNTLVVLPTGMGKTAIFLMMAAYRLNMYPKSKILLLGPTRPLIEQYSAVFDKYFNIEKEKMSIFTGFVGPEKRAELWKTSQIIFSTPQGLENDIISNKIDLSTVSLIGFDESHRATGEYSYTFIAQQYQKKALHPRILALTASPGSDNEKIKEVCKNLFIEKIEVRTATDEDVSPYVQDVEMQKIYVDLPDAFLEIKKYLDLCFNGKLRELKQYGLVGDLSRYSKKNMLGAQAEIHSRIMQGDREMETLRSLSLLAELMKLQHAIELLETQGIKPLKEYINKLHHEASTGKTKAAKNLVMDVHFRSAAIKIENMQDTHDHPKLIELKRIVSEELDGSIPENLEKKIIIFSQYRDAGSKIVHELNDAGFKAKLFVGQAKKKDTGLSQKKQKEMLEDFSNLKFNVLVSSSVGEEGLDIPQVDLVVFYEPVPSAIRKIQRSGRTGRLDKGRIIMLITKDTIDEIYYHVAKNKEKRMYRAIGEIKKDFGVQTANNFVKPGRTLNDFAEKTEISKLEQNSQTQIKIIADYREKGSYVLKELINKEIRVSLEKLSIGDFLISQRVAVEYKNVQDFVDSIIDGRLLFQLKELKKYERPLFIIEGSEDMYAVRKIHPNAIRGMIATITVSYGIPLIQTKNARDTAELLMTIAKKEQLDEKSEVTYHYAKPLTLKEQQEYFISALPNIGMGGAKPLLKHFKSVKNIVNASEQELQDVDLIGPKKSKTLKELFEGEWRE
jgi:Fanconi anemia group M protein